MGKSRSLSRPLIKKLLEGFSALHGLWDKGLFPEDLKHHYVLYWFVVYDGNIIRMAQALQIHRNTVHGHFRELGHKRNSIQLRREWQEIREKSSGSFEKKFFHFYRRTATKSKLSMSENGELISLWRTLFPYKILIHHYLLWAVRRKRSKAWLQSKLGYSYRNLALLFAKIIKPQTRPAFWLSPLKLQASEIYSERYRSQLL